jgi:hypothetical protein
VFTAGAHHALASRPIAAAGRVAHDVASARSADLLRATPTAARDPLADAIHDAAGDGMAALLAVAGLVGVAGGVTSFVMLRERPAVEVAARRTQTAKATAQ